MAKDDVYKTIVKPTEGTYSEKRSKFTSFAYPVESEEQVKELLEEIRNKYYDARHVCYAYRIGHDQVQYRANDDGEPSGTAGRPILGQIRSFELTNVLVAVVRYFGGIKLGTGGLIVAYKAAAAAALEQAEVVSCTVDETLSFRFEYPFMNDVMRIVKEMDAEVKEQTFYLDCQMTLSIRRSEMETLADRIRRVQSVQIEGEEEDAKEEVTNE